MDSITSFINKIGWYITGSNNNTPVAQSTASGQWSVMTQLQPQLISELPKVQQQTPNLSPRAVDMKWFADNLQSYVTQWPTLNFDILWNLPRMQTPQWVFNQQTQQVEDRQWNAIGTPLQAIQQQNPTTPYQQLDQAPIIDMAKILNTTPEKVQSITEPNTSRILLDETTKQAASVQAGAVNLPTDVNKPLEQIINKTQEVKQEEPKLKGETVLSTIVSTVRDIAWWAVQLASSITNPIADAEFIWSKYPSVLKNVIEKNTVDAWSFVWNPIVAAVTAWINAPLIAYWASQIDDLDKLMDSNWSISTENQSKIKQTYPELDINQLQWYLTERRWRQEEQQKIVQAVTGKVELSRKETLKAVEIEKEKLIKNPYVDSYESMIFSKFFDTAKKQNLSDLDSMKQARKAQEWFRMSVSQIVEPMSSLKASKWYMNSLDKTSSDIIVDAVTSDKVYEWILSNYATLYEVAASDWSLTEAQRTASMIKFLESEWFWWATALSDYLNQPIIEAIKTIGWPDGQALEILTRTTMSVDDTYKAIAAYRELIYNNNWLLRLNWLVEWASNQTLSLTKMTLNAASYVWYANLEMHNAQDSYVADAWKFFPWQFLNAELPINADVDFDPGWSDLLEDSIWTLSKSAPEIANWVMWRKAFENIWWSVQKWLEWQKWNVWSVKIWENAKRFVSQNSVDLVFSWINRTVRATTKLLPELMKDYFQWEAIQGMIPSINSQEDINFQIIWAWAAAMFEIVPAAFRVFRWWSSYLKSSFWVANFWDEIVEWWLRSQDESKTINKTILEKEETIARIKELKDQNIDLSEATEQAIAEQLKVLTPQERQAITTASQSRKTYSTREIQDVRDMLNATQRRLEALYQTNPEAAKWIAMRAYVTKTMDEIMSTVWLSSQEWIQQLTKVLWDLKTNFWNLWDAVAGQIQRDLKTINPVLIWTSYSNKYWIIWSLDWLKKIADSWLQVPSNVKNVIWDVDLSKEISEDVFAKLSDFGITKDNVWDFFTETKNGYRLNQYWLDKLWVIDPEWLVIKKTIQETWSDDMVNQFVQKKLWDQQYQLIQDSNAIQNIYKSLSTLC